jgi:hypothetical protein
MKNEYLIRVYNVFVSKMLNDITALRADKFIDIEHAKKVSLAEETVKNSMITEELQALYEEETNLRN